MKKSKKEIKKDKAITLIALVVTIIILLILAGVTIGVATNGTGLFEKAKLATDEYNNSVQKENTELAKVGNEIDSYVDGNRDGIASNNYSTTEKIVGKWINDKPLYQKTIETTLPDVTTDGTAVTKTVSLASLGIVNSDEIWIDNSASFKTSRQGHSENIWSYNVGHANSANMGSMVWCSEGNINVRSTRKDQNHIRCVITLKYTKTSD